jgi:hypothetical protein
MRVIALALLLLSSSLGCGGSSSETPPPLEPDPTSGRYLGPRFPKAEAAPAPAAAAPDDEDDAPVKPRRAAPSTWGSGKPAPTASTPAMSSPTALPSTQPF